MRLVPKNWGDFQHYKDRSPPWIKLHKTILSDRLFMRLPLASKALAPLLWLLASESKSENGEFDASTEELEFRLHMTAKDIEAGRKSLIDKGFFIVASGVLANCLQPACLETETEGERETKERQSTAAPREDLFEEFWKAYPKKKAKDDAKRAFDKRKPTRALVDSMLAAIRFQSLSMDWVKDNGQFIPYPASWLNSGSWQDSETVTPLTVVKGRDPTLIKLDEDAKRAAPMPESLRQKFSEITKRMTQ